MPVLLLVKEMHPLQEGKLHTLNAGRSSGWSCGSTTCTSRRFVVVASATDTQPFSSNHLAQASLDVLGRVQADVRVGERGVGGGVTQSTKQRPHVRPVENMETPTCKVWVE